MTYNPNFLDLENLIQKIVSNNRQIIVVDNFSDSTDRKKLKEIVNQFNCHLILLDKNYGIATAQNKGIEVSRSYHSDFLVFFDQDSDPSSNLIESLIEAHTKLLQRIPATKIGILGARYTDSRQDNPPPFLRFEGLKMVRCPCETKEDIVEVDYVIASGSMVSSTALDRIGTMKEELFIDYVDIEWGLRAKSKGMQNFGVCNAFMNHSLGDNPKKWGKKMIPIHSPLRHYYHFRNAILLYKLSWVPWNWKLVDGYRLLLKFVFYSIFTDRPWNHFKMMSLGIIHGIVGKSGSINI